MNCFMCESDNIIPNEVFDVVCSNEWTTECICDECGHTWYDDTLEE